MASTRPKVAIETSFGTIEVEIADDAAPATAAHFLSLVDQDAYDDGSFHRTVTPTNQPNDTIRISVIQGTIANDWSKDGLDPVALERTNVTGLRHLDGVISMARFAPDSALADFFICIGDQPDLDFGGLRNPDGQGFAAFGRVVAGMDVVRAINEAPCVEQSLQPPVAITRVSRRNDDSTGADS